MIEHSWCAKANNYSLVTCRSCGKYTQKMVYEAQAVQKCVFGVVT